MGIYTTPDLGSTTPADCVVFVGDNKYALSPLMRNAGELDHG